jgi:hypothetical protein
METGLKGKDLKKQSRKMRLTGGNTYLVDVKDS